MVCVYCGHETQVINSRHQKRLNQVWRRRKCSACKAVFTTIEAPDATQALRLRHVTAKGTTLEPFSRDILLLSIYDSLKHRLTASTDATALTATALSTLYTVADDGVIDRDALIELVGLILEHFDNVAAVHYRAYHQLS